MERKFGSAEILARIEFGLKLASRRFLEQRAANDQTIIISENGAIKHVPAKDVLRKRDMEDLAEYLKNANLGQ
ncbi:MAG: hypothetical protein H7257_12960 [Taibaiella sp.]|nr:hypothetical protein [Taibaiella sp.]